MEWRVFADTGGTFTDVFGYADGLDKPSRVKVLSSGVLRFSVDEVESEESAFWVRWEFLTPNHFFKDYTVVECGGNPCVCSIVDSQVKGDRVRLSVEHLPEEIQRGDVLSVSGGEDAPVLGARVLTGTLLAEKLPIREFRIATTRGTNALLEEKGARVAFFVTAGFRDLLKIGNQQRPDLFAMVPQRAEPLYEGVFEISERLGPDGSIERMFNQDEARSQIAAAKAAGFEAVAISFLHGYKQAAHEVQMETMVREAGFSYVARASQLAPFIKWVPRAGTTVVDAYLGPIMERYLDSVEKACGRGVLRVMTSSGGLVTRRSFFPKDSLLSGPAGGVVGVEAVGRRAGEARLISFDMGGTSTDVARISGGFDYTAMQRVGRAEVLGAGLRIETVAAGGGSVCQVVQGAPVVGPESAGASPGPACYGAGGPLTVTDVNLLLGRLCPERFSFELSAKASAAAFALVKEALPQGSHAESDAEVLEGFLTLADQRMADAIRKISVREGYAADGMSMVSFGGAGGQHACAVAEALGMSRILSPADAGLLSAYGLGCAQLQSIQEREFMESMSAMGSAVDDTFEAMFAAAKAELKKDGAVEDLVEADQRVVFLRFSGQEACEEIEYTEGVDLSSKFLEAYEEKYGYLPGKQAIEVVRLRGVYSAGKHAFAGETFSAEKDGKLNAESTRRQRCYIDGRWREIDVFERERLRVGDRIKGPALVSDPYSVLLIAPGWSGTMGSAGTLRLDLTQGQRETRESTFSGANEWVRRELVVNRMSSLVEEMGILLERTALSTNIKERLDFSCALLDRQGHLIANAPHVPVHLGALGLCVRTVAGMLDLESGDVVVTNHPGFGGSHLPDVTVISPLFRKGKLLGYLVNRAHHAELGGIRPGSMPPNAKNLAEEGVVITPQYLFRRGKSCLDTFSKVLTEGPYPSRAPTDNIADLNAQLAANRLGEKAFLRMVDEVGEKMVSESMEAVKTRAGRVLWERLSRYVGQKLEADEVLDDGTPLRVEIRINEQGIVVDFSGSGAQHPANLNATPAIINSAVMYVFRLLVNETLPLNEGLLQGVDIRIPEGTLLNPVFPVDATACPPVVGGNVEVSQRVVDLLLKAFDLVACSQGTMNNFVFGGDGYGSYYETMGGGAGAAEGQSGGSGLHTHMTNTAITDVEILERRYPVRITQFSLRKGSGGVGQWSGGEGYIRRFRFEAPLKVSLLTQHRVQRPYGMQGGAAGAPGKQLLLRKGTASPESLGGWVDFEALPGDELEVRTPGGGGFGVPAKKVPGGAEGKV